MDKEIRRKIEEALERNPRERPYVYRERGRKRHKIRGPHPRTRRDGPDEVPAVDKPPHSTAARASYMRSWRSRTLKGRRDQEAALAYLEAVVEMNRIRYRGRRNTAHYESED